MKCPHCKEQFSYDHACEGVKREKKELDKLYRECPSMAPRSWHYEQLEKGSISAWIRYLFR